MSLELLQLIEELFRLYEERSAIERVLPEASVNLQQELEDLLHTVMEATRNCAMQILQMRDMASC